MNIKNKTLAHATPVARCRKGPWAALAMTVSLVSGCGFIDPRKDVDMHQVATTVNRPVVRPVRSMSNFSESLTCMDHLLRAANLPPTLITSKQFIDFSNKVPVATKDMVVTSLSRMSRLSPGYSTSRTATVVGLEAQLGDFRTRTIVPGLDSANEIVIGGGGDGVNVAGSIGAVGLQLTTGRDYALGMGGAIRTLVDLAMIELVGKWARVPYWQCLTLDQSDPNFQRQMRDWFDQSGPGGQLQLVRSSLTNQGYLPAGSDGLALNSPALRAALSRFQADRGIVVSGRVDFPTYEAALRNFVALGDDGALTRIGWTSGGTTQVATADGGTAAAIGLTTPAPWTIDLRLENPQPAGERPAFTEGEQVFLSASVSRASHLYCYFADSGGTVMRLLPNALQPHSLVSANNAVRIPDWMAPNPGFILDAGKPGTESVTCMATSEDATPKLPPGLQVPALTALQGVKGTESLQQQFAAAVGQDAYVAQTLQWQVAPRRAAPANAAAPAAAK